MFQVYFLICKFKYLLIILLTIYRYFYFLIKNIQTLNNLISILHNLTSL